MSNRAILNVSGMQNTTQNRAMKPAVYRYWLDAGGQQVHLMQSDTQQTRRRSRLHAVRISRPVGGAAGRGSASGASPTEMRPSTRGPVSRGTWCQARKPINAIR